MKRKLLALAMSSFMLLGLTGCGGTQETVKTDTESKIVSPADTGAPDYAKNTCWYKIPDITIAVFKNSVSIFGV